MGIFASFGLDFLLAKLLLKCPFELKINKNRTFLTKYLHMSENSCNFAANLKVHYLVDHQTVYRVNINK